MKFPRQDYWCRLPFPPLGNTLDPGIEPTSPVLVDEFFTTGPPGKVKQSTGLPKSNSPQLGLSWHTQFQDFKGVCPDGGQRCLWLCGEMLQRRNIQMRAKWPCLLKTFHVLRNHLGSFAKNRSRVEAETVKNLISKKFLGDVDAAGQTMTLWLWRLGTV